MTFVGLDLRKRYITLWAITNGHRARRAAPDARLDRGAHQCPERAARA